VECPVCEHYVPIELWAAHVESGAHKRRVEALPVMRPDGVVECARCGVRYMAHVNGDLWRCKCCGTLQREPAGQSLAERFLERLGRADR